MIPACYLRKVEISELPKVHKDICSPKSGYFLPLDYPEYMQKFFLFIKKKTFFFLECGSITNLKTKSLGLVR
jgi:hypothetical protein